MSKKSYCLRLVDEKEKFVWTDPDKEGFGQHIAGTGSGSFSSHEEALEHYRHWQPHWPAHHAPKVIRCPWEVKSRNENIQLAAACFALVSLIVYVGWFVPDVAAHCCLTH